MKLKKLTNILEFFYPPKHAYDWDNVGLLIGDERRDVNRVLTTLEITNDVIDEAIERKIDLIVSHHPIIFKPIKSLNFKDPYVRMYVKLIKNNIAVYCMHTNVDVAPYGMNDWLAEVLEMKNLSLLETTGYLEEMKLELDCLPSGLSDVVEVLNKVGVGHRGENSQNISIVSKVKQIKRLDCDVEELEIVNIEACFSEDLLSKLKYELSKLSVLGYRVVKFENQDMAFGLGKVGTVKHQSLESLACKLKDLYSLKKVKVVGDSEQIISKVAILGGSGASYIRRAKVMGCDALITGDIGFHDAQLAIACNIALIDPGHNIEIIFNDAMSKFINLLDDVVCVSSEIDTDPFEII